MMDTSGIVRVSSSARTEVQSESRPREYDVREITCEHTDCRYEVWARLTWFYVEDHL